MARGELDEAQPYCFEPGTCVGGSGVLRGLRHAAELSLADIMHLSLVVSDNDATNIIASAVGLERVNDLAAELGLTQTRMQRLMMDQEAVAAGRENHTSAGDLALLLEELSSGEALEPLVGERVLASLELQEHLDGIARYLPPEACYAGKCGDDSPVGRYAHDCALVRRRRPAGGAGGDDARLRRVRDGRAHRRRAVRGARRSLAPRRRGAARPTPGRHWPRACTVSRPAAPPAPAPPTR